MLAMYTYARQSKVDVLLRMGMAKASDANTMTVTRYASVRKTSIWFLAHVISTGGKKYKIVDVSQTLPTPLIAATL